MLFIFQNIELDNVVVKDIVNGAVDLELNFQAGQTGNSVANAGACLGREGIVPSSPSFDSAF